MAIYDQKPMVGRTDNAKKLKQSESVRRKKNMGVARGGLPTMGVTRGGHGRRQGVDMPTMGVATGWTCPPHCCQTLWTYYSACNLSLSHTTW